MFFPYRDDNPRRHGPPLATLAVIALCTAVFLLVQLPLGPRQGQAYALSFGFIPAVFFGQAELPVELARVPAAATLVTSMFSHGGVIHLVGNMWFLWLYGDNVEDAMGWPRYLLFFLICGIAGTLAHAALDPASRVPLVGASGAISGVIAAYLLIWPRANIRVFYWFYFLVGTVNVPAYVVLGLWIGEQLFALPAAMQAQGGIAIVAHLGGFATGLALTPVLKRRGVGLLQSPHSAAFSHSRTRAIRRRGWSVPEVKRKRD
ncbi:MAG: rhomboid family intramembrane serine protease [Paracoccaceae bacterium]